MYLFTVSCSFYEIAQVWPSFIPSQDAYPEPLDVYAKFYLGIFGLPASVLFYFYPRHAYFPALLAVGAVFSWHLYLAIIESHYLSPPDAVPLSAPLFVISRLAHILPAALALFFAIRCYPQRTVA